MKRFLIGLFLLDACDGKSQISPEVAFSVGIPIYLKAPGYPSRFPDYLKNVKGTGRVNFNSSLDWKYLPSLQAFLSVSWKHVYSEASYFHVLAKRSVDFGEFKRIYRLDERKAFFLLGPQFSLKNEKRLAIVFGAGYSWDFMRMHNEPTFPKWNKHINKEESKYMTEHIDWNCGLRLTFHRSKTKVTFAMDYLPAPNPALVHAFVNVHKSNPSPYVMGGNGPVGPGSSRFRLMVGLSLLHYQKENTQVEK